MPGVFRLGFDTLVDELAGLINRPKHALEAVLLFGVMSAESKDDNGDSFARSPVIKALQLLKEAYGTKLMLAVDICLCGYTSHGHCGVLNADGSINNAASVQQLTRMAVAFADAGADLIAPSDMMDGRIGAIKEALANREIGVMSYAAKFKSCLYGPFRDAADSAPSFGDRAAYQLPAAARDLALRAAKRDYEQGADFLMVKPGTLYLDIIRDLKNTLPLPLAVYHVSGEYAALIAGANAGAFDLKAAVLETMTAFLRAGCEIVISYFTPQILDWLSNDI
jgi:porphobilinogen synthase